MRNVKFDNAKAMLISLVVLGHMLELELGYGVNKSLYILIYSFHMPFFVYLTGYFSKNKPVAWIKTLLCPYVIFQTLYSLFQTYLLGTEVKLQYLKPYWILWYLWAVLIWNIALLGIRTCNSGIQHLVLAGAILLSLGVGYLDGIGRELSLSRIFVFFPFFLWGYLAHQKERVLGRKSLFVLIPLVSLLIGILLWKAPVIQVAWLYEANSYARGGYTLGFRLFHLGSAVIWILLFQQIITRKTIPFFTRLGQNTMPIYLLHGFVIKWIGTYAGFITPFHMIVITTLILVLFSFAGRAKGTKECKTH